MQLNQAGNSESNNVLFLSGDMPLGGAASFVLNVCEGLTQTGGTWQAIAGVFTELGAVGEQMLARGGGMLGPFHGRLLHEDYMELMHRECRRLQPAAIVANIGGNTFDFLRFVPESVLRIAMVHSDDESVYRQIERYVPWIDLVVGVSARNRETMESRLIGDTPPVVQIACGVPMGKNVLRTVRDAGPLRILYLGRVDEEQKRISLMKEVMRRTLDSSPDVEWTIAGDGPELNSLRQTFAADNERVKTPGALDYAEIPALLAAHDVYFLCSDYEGLPLSMLEAMGEGLVPVVSDLPSGISEVVNSTNGFRVPIHGAGGYVAALDSLRTDRRRLAEMSLAACDRVREEYSTEAMARRWERALNEHAKPGRPDWSTPCVADAPPETRASLVYHPRLRGLRKLLKSITK